MPRLDLYMDRLDAEYRTCRAEEYRLARLHQDDPDHPDLEAATERTEKALSNLLLADATSVDGVLVKLRLAIREGRLDKDLSPTRPSASTRALFSALGDLERMAGVGDPTP